MTDVLSEATATLARSDDDAAVAIAARDLGLLLERARFDERGAGALDELDGPLEEASLRFDARARADVVDCLLGHLDRRGGRSVPTVVWALGKAADPIATRRIAALARLLVDDETQDDLLYQCLVALAVEGSDDDRDVFSRGSLRVSGEAGDFARHFIDHRGW